MRYAYRPSGFGSYELVGIEVYKLSSNLYQVEAGKRAFVTKAKNKLEALKKACRVLRLNCNKLLLKVENGFSKRS